MNIWRSRWAAVGAAVAVTLGGGGLFSVGAASPESTFVAIEPVRVLDTRFDIGLVDAFQHRVARTLDVTGSIPTVGPGNTEVASTVVPVGATAIVANVTAVNPTTPGFVAVRPGTATGDPTTSNVNFSSAGVVVPNSVTVELPTSGLGAGTLNLFFSGTGAGATTQLLIDIVGYYVEGAGAPGPKGDQGEPGQDGGDGPQGPAAWDVIPSGTTVTGEINAYVYSGVQQAVYFAGGTLPGKAPVDLVTNTVNFADTGPPVSGSDADTTCTGSVADPTAPAGKVCLYLSSSSNVFSLSGLQGNLADRAFLIAFFSNAVGDMNVNATWAYTAP